jgi:uncharacterized SAM-binding protein YcdF (DUF218 family)
VDRTGRHDNARQSDVVVVLGARIEANGQPSSDLASRITHGIELWKAGLAPFIICTGGFKDERLSAAAVCRRTAIQRGVPADRIALADGTMNTVEDAQATARVMAEHGWHTAILVSHPLHLFRTHWLFKRVGVESVISPTAARIDRIPLSLRLWYTAREVGAVVATAVDLQRWLPPEWRTRLQQWSYRLP